MRRDIDYRDYDPHQFLADHPDDPVVSKAQDQARQLADMLSNGQIEGTPLDQRREVEQGFDRIQMDLWDGADMVNKVESHYELLAYSDKQLKETFDQGLAGVERSRRPEGEIAAWQGVPQELERARSISMQEARASDPEFNERMVQLEQYQSARNEAASNEIGLVRDAVLKERGLDKVEDEPHPPAGPSQPDGSRNAIHIPEDHMAAAAERGSQEGPDPQAEQRARIREALARLDTSHEKPGQSRDHVPEVG